MRLDAPGEIGYPWCDEAAVGAARAREGRGGAHEGGMKRTVLGAMMAMGLGAAACGDAESAPGADTAVTADTTDAGLDAIAPDTTAPDAAAGDAADVPDAGEVIDARVELVVMSYNVMCSFCSFEDHVDWVAAWDERLPWLRDTVTRHDPDLIGVQELSTIDGSAPDQVDAIGGGDGTYAAVFYRTQPGDTLPYDYPDPALLYRAARFELKDDGVFWLSPTPDVAFTHGWNDGPAAPRLVLWAILHDRYTGVDLTVATTHFDNNFPNQQHSAPLTLERFAPMAAARPLIFVGDFNSAPSTVAYATLATGVEGQGFHFENAFDHAPGAPTLVPAVGHATDWSPERRIDHIWFAGADFNVSNWTVDLQTYGERDQAASDHYAIVSTLSL